MRNGVKNPQQAQNAPVADVSSTKRTNLDKLSKSQLIELLQGDIKAPITPAELYRAAVSIVAKWCNDVVSGGYDVKDFSKKFAKSKYTRIFVMRDRCNLHHKVHIERSIKRCPLSTSAMQLCRSRKLNRGNALFCTYSNF